MHYLVENARARKLDRITIGYTVAAWAVIQAVSLGASAFLWPPSILQTVILTAIVGLPIALIGAWVLGVTSEAGGQFKPTRADLHVLMLLSVVLLVAAGLFVWIFWPRTAPATAAAQQTVPQAPPNSVAVLPFANLSGDSAKQYISDGIADELIGELSRIPSLRVAARTSSFAFAGRHVDVKTIASQLNVRTILDGSVRESANHVRIEAELVNARTGYAIWSETYDRDLTDILALQDDIAGAVTRSLRVKLLGDQFDARDTQGINPEAYKMYLQAKAFGDRGNQGDLLQAAELLKKVTALEPRYANGFSALAAAYRNLADLYNKTEFVAPAEAASDRAIELDPKNLQALTTRMYLFLDKWRWNDAFEIFRKVEAINPNGAMAQRLRAELAFTFNYPEADIAAELKGAELDPLSPARKYNIGLWYWNHRQYDAAAAVFRQLLKLRPGKLTDQDMLCASEVGRGNLDEAHRIVEKISSFYADSPQNSLNCPFYLAIAEKNVTRARKITDAAAADAAANGGSYFNIGDAYRQIGDFDHAMKWYERAYDVRDSLLLGAPFEAWQTPALLNDPRWKALWARPPIKEWEAARVKVGEILALSK